jgi:hypothetical protein
MSDLSSLGDGDVTEPDYETMLRESAPAEAGTSPDSWPGAGRWCDRVSGADAALDAYDESDNDYLDSCDRCACGALLVSCHGCAGERCLTCDPYSGYERTNRCCVSGPHERDVGAFDARSVGL